MNRAERRALKFKKTRVGGHSHGPGGVKFATRQEKVVSGRPIVIMKEAKK